MLTTENTEEPKAVKLEKHCCRGGSGVVKQLANRRYQLEGGYKRKKKRRKIKENSVKNQNAHQHLPTQGNVPSNEENCFTLLTRILSM